MRPILAFDLTNFTDSCINVTKAELAARFSGATNHLTYIFVWHVTLTIIIITIPATKIVQVAIRKYASKYKNILPRACHSFRYIRMKGNDDFSSKIMLLSIMLLYYVFVIMYLLQNIS